MTDIQFSSDIPVKLLAVHASDDDVIAAARISTAGDQTDADVKSKQGFIDFLVKNRHGSPFEHNFFKFMVTAPIFVWREHHRHRIGLSYNEESGRYKQLEPHFYLPAANRPLVQIGKAGAYEFVPGTAEQLGVLDASVGEVCKTAYAAYEKMLDEGIAREVARMVLPVNTFSSCIVTMNARSMMNFLSLRTKETGSFFPSYPQAEIEMVARQYEQAFAEAMPLTYRSFCENGRVAP